MPTPGWRRSGTSLKANPRRPISVRAANGFLAKTTSSTITSFTIPTATSSATSHRSNSIPTPFRSPRGSMRPAPIGKKACKNGCSSADGKACSGNNSPASNRFPTSLLKKSATSTFPPFRKSTNSPAISKKKSGNRLK